MSSSTPKMKRIPSSIRVRRTDSEQRGGSEEPQDDDSVLRDEMRTVRLAIHDERRRERRGESPVQDNMGADLPPIRMDEVPERKSSRHYGAVEHLALRHKQHHTTQVRNNRRKDRLSTSTTSSSSEASASEQDLQRLRTQSRGSNTQPQPQPQRNLSHVTEENTSSRLATPNAQPDQSYFAESSTSASSIRPRRNTVGQDGIIATSRQFFENMLGWNNDQPAKQMEEEDDNQDDLQTPSTSEVSDVHEDEVVDYLDVVDPEVSTVTALQNMGNSIFFPPIPKLYNRRPTISLPAMGPRRPSRAATPASEHHPADDIEMAVPDASGSMPSAKPSGAMAAGRNGFNRAASYVTGKRKKAVPETTEEERRKHIREWAEMDEDERCELDEHVEMLLTKKAKFKRGLKGFWRYVKTPHGLIITVYAVLVTFWGTAICLFLLRWINVHNAARQRYWIEICDQILCALFSAVGLGFAPFRAVDTYRMIQIVHYHKLTYKRRKQLDLPKLQDKNELPRATPRISAGQMANNVFIKTGLRKDPNANNGDIETNQSSLALDMQTSRHSSEVERLKEERENRRRRFRRHKKAEGEDGGHKKVRELPPTYVNKDGVVPLGHLKRNPSIASELVRDAEDVVVLTPKQQANLEYQQRKFHESHTFYRYRETVTHRPFELSLMIAVVILLDCHSCLQASLGGTTWGIYYKNRPTSVTATIITFSLSCNAVAGILIGWGGSRTKKKDEVKRLLRIALEEQALHKIQKKHKRQQLEQEQQQQRQLESAQTTAPSKPPPEMPVVQQTPTLERIQED